MRRSIQITLFLLIFLLSFQPFAAVFAADTPLLPEVVELTIGIAPADYKALVTESEKTSYDVYTKVGNGAYQNASINIRGYSSRFIGLRTPARRIPFELKFADKEAFSNEISNKSVKFISSLTPYRLIAEYLALELFDYAGIPTPAHTFTFIRFNDVDFGLYIAVEDLNKTFLNKWYSNASHYLLKATPDGSKADQNIDSSRWFGSLFEKVGNDTQSIQRLLDALNSGGGYETGDGSVSQRFETQNRPLSQSITDTNYPLQTIGSKQFIAFHDKPIERSVMEINEIIRPFVTEEQARIILTKLCGANNATDFQRLPQPEQVKSVVTARKKGASVRQLNRLTGLSRGMIERWCKEN